MAFYHDMPKKNTGKTNYGNQGSWDDEGSHYSDRRSGSRYGSSEQDGRHGGRTFSKGTRGESRDTVSSRSTYPGNDRSRIKGLQGNREGFVLKTRRNDSESFGPDASFGKRDGYATKSNKNRRDDPASGRFQGKRDTFTHREQNGNAAAVFREKSDRREAFAQDKERNGVYHEAVRDHRDYEYHMPREEYTTETAPENILCGRNPIREAIKNGRDIEKLLVLKGELSGSAREIVQMAHEAHIPVQEVEKVRLDEITLHHQGMIAFASAYAYATVEEMLAEAERKQEAPFLILLDGVTDPHNLGAIIRTADCAGAHGVIVPQRRSVGLTPAAVKASAGAVEHVKVARVTNLNRTIEELKKRNVWAYAVTMNGKDYEKMDFSGGVALVIGAEGEGISRLTLESCDCAVSLPMKGHLDSLNASVAAGIMMYRVMSSRK